MAFAIQNTEKRNFHPNEGLGIDSLDLNPRILGIYFGDRSGKLIKELQSNEFIILQDLPTMDEPFDGLEILTNGVLKIDFHFWFSAGSWSISNSSYQFRFQHNHFELIDYHSNETHRSTGESIDYSINFSKIKMVIINTKIDNDTLSETVKKECINFELENMKSIQSLEKPFKWEFNGIYL